MMIDRVFQAFLAEQQAAGLALAGSSDLLTLLPLGPAPAQRYLAFFECRGLVHEDGEIRVADHWRVAITFPDDYLRRPDSAAWVTLLAPLNAFHANIAGPLICIGRMPPGTGLVDLLWQVFDLITWNRVTMSEPDALNKAACQFARNHPDRYPIDKRPLRRPQRLPAIGPDSVQRESGEAT